METKLKELETRIESMQEGIHLLMEVIPAEIKASNINLVTMSNNLAGVQVLVSEIVSTNKRIALLLNTKLQ